MIRNYATAAAKRPSRLKRPLGLDHFIQGKRAIALWRDIVRTTAAVPDLSTRDEMRQFARREFEKHRDVTDISHIRYLISAGKTEFDAVRSSLINANILK
ncbi:uncharacterized protein K441DRAFT_632272 [Cenococcum geophilum 1.58]|uniref:uncharacterized protein n=1 Tax=Cenococcum geophilum 1.58 TaxID=794803 RepID=UPI00358EA0BC|nr:hypothetical protein K441DRAFT_632272 [Cenococcum geophilum 1.58]